MFKRKVVSFNLSKSVSREDLRTLLADVKREQANPSDGLISRLQNFGFPLIRTRLIQAVNNGSIESILKGQLPREASAVNQGTVSGTASAQPVSAVAGSLPKIETPQIWFLIQTRDMESFDSSALNHLKAFLRCSTFSTDMELLRFYLPDRVTGQVERIDISSSDPSQETSILLSVDSLFSIYLTSTRFSKRIVVPVLSSNLLAEFGTRLAMFTSQLPEGTICAPLMFRNCVGIPPEISRLRDLRVDPNKGGKSLIGSGDMDTKMSNVVKELRRITDRWSEPVQSYSFEDI
ncbi:hypothetical protein A2526_06010 [candidate division WOR-1 bacterium RIFOXYD2_FULL_36_8]|uniref:Uncharacterized protein n=1 Tax=candidate division WOR-1 bacterium RIFOXYB2_FULL_36_35 TaxID=1802578 RepID=A0A1F4S5R0_UNCSA|nr:MAG: hypothetical protein A2230_05005 [candidate division WOR-1 bacterium RIFOXYA2_FULL_36_21]OGC15762.1 MAG: hypothetical protein A2290_05430 [candidate division WOR-1 bacterium RIFOXYB2_FULL_36_35]OGC21117.1 MAG: hypothetical protein A2282_03760 [candidate division WOR-1 bacterium RIFOXYA12_FULL_36_13]OGC39028.1 MAG: hypothetical protein A2526_06010 [candidate division WOR-1 bacterium RIFOXYD2_FULL_36_8]